jgi:external thioesterase TEII
MKKPQLFLLHFAGGNRYSFQFMIPHLKDFDIIVPELPGRGRRMNEQLITDFDLAATEMYNQISMSLLSPSFMIYGHSMGAYLALRVTNMLERAGTPPLCLVVSGNAGPGMATTKDRYLLSKEDFIGELKKLGGIPEELIENEEMFNLFEPVLRSDFEIAERNNAREEPAVKAPLFAMMGDQEEDVEHIANWNKYTHSRFDHIVMEGDHFFIHKHPKDISAIIKGCYERSFIIHQF